MKILVINCSPVRDGATAEIVKTVSKQVSHGNEVRTVCIDDYKINFCKGYRTCHTSANYIKFMKNISKKFIPSNFLNLKKYWKNM